MVCCERLAMYVCVTLCLRDVCVYVYDPMCPPT